MLYVSVICLESCRTSNKFGIAIISPVRKNTHGTDGIHLFYHECGDAIAFLLFVGNSDIGIFSRVHSSMINIFCRGTSSIALAYNNWLQFGLNEYPGNVSQKFKISYLSAIKFYKINT